MLESVKNVFNFSVPFLSWLAFVVVFFITIVLYFVPLRYVSINCNRDSQLSTLLRVLLILWGTNKFLKKLIKPWAVNNNELADFISRVPDHEELVTTGCFIMIDIKYMLNARSIRHYVNQNGWQLSLHIFDI